MAQKNNNQLLTERVLPLLDISKEMFTHLNLSNTLIISVQHLYSTTYSLFKALFDLGLQPKNLYVLGKCYSSDPKVYNQLLKDKVNASPSSLYFNSHVAYDDYFDSEIKNFLENIKNNESLFNFERIIILDDGGHLLEQVLSTFPKNLNLVGIEQTSSGYNRLNARKHLSFPIINLARSWLKLEYETPIIINLVQKKIIEKLQNFNFKSKKFLILGNGILGNYIYKMIKNNCEVSIFDTNSQKSSITNERFLKNLSDFDVIIGCTGAVSLSFEKFSFLKKPVSLISVSSSDREFDAVHFRKQTDPIFNCHENINFDGINLLSCGFPINFDKDFDAIDTDDFQLTRALLFIAICQAFGTNLKTKGFIDLNDANQKMIFNHMEI